MEIVFVTAEVLPFSKVGGLGDVTSALAKALRSLGHKVHVVSLLYGNIDAAANSLARRLMRVNVPLGNESIAAEVYETRLASGVQVTLLNAPGLTDRPRVYGEPDDARRFAFLARGAVEWMRAQPKMPDIVHAHDWPAGLVPLFLRIAAETDPRLAALKSVFTIHHMAFQGVFPLDDARACGIPDRWLVPESMEFFGAASWLKAGIVHADKVTTVSPTYARDITTAAGGERLDGVLRMRARDLVGIANGIDFAVWNPSTDPHLIAHYDAEDASPKDRCRADLLARTGLVARPAPLVATVGRFDRHKGMDLLVEAAPQLMRQDFSLIVLGDGDAGIAESLRELARRFPDRVFVKQGFDDALAHKIYGGADLFLAPARVAPSGLSVMHALRYGCVPIACAVGGIRDAVVDCDRELETGTGFLFDHPGADELSGAVARALSAWRKHEPFAKLRRRVMRQELSWERSARRYQSLYATLVDGGDGDHATA